MNIFFILRRGWGNHADLKQCGLDFHFLFVYKPKGMRVTKILVYIIGKQQ